MAEVVPGAKKERWLCGRTSKHTNMKELRTQVGGEPLRTFFAFDPRRTAILLIGGNMGGEGRFYDRMISIADRLYDTHLEELKSHPNLSIERRPSDPARSVGRCLFAQLHRA